jgi:hypothetical protein
MGKMQKYLCMNDKDFMNAPGDSFAGEISKITVSKPEGENGRGLITG